MLKINLRCRLFLLLAAALMHGCMTSPTTLIKTPHNDYPISQLEQLDARQKANLYEAILAADIASHNQDYLTATSYYLFAADLAQDQRLIEKAIESAQQAGDPLALEQAAVLWLKREPNNIAAKTLKLKAQLGQQNLINATETAMNYTQSIPDITERLAVFEQSVLSEDPRTVFNLMRDVQAKNPQDPVSPLIVSKLFSRLAARSQKPEGILEQALKYAEDSIAIAPLYMPAIYQKSQVLVQLRRDATAKAFLAGLTQSHPNSKPLNLMLGQLLYDLKNYPDSISHFKKWLNNHDDDQEARFYLAASYYANREFKLALPHFVQLVDEEFKLEKVAFYCGDSAMKSQQKQQAIDCFKLVNEGRFVVHAKVFLSKLYAEQKELGLAQAVLAAEDSLSDSAKARLMSAEVDLLKEHFSLQQAQNRLQEGISLYPDNLSLLLKKIELFQLADKPKALFQTLSEAKDLIEKEDKRQDFNLAAAALLNDNGHHQEAINWLNEALILQPEDRDLLYTRALYKEHLGLYDEMIEEFKSLHQKYPDDLNIKNALGYTLADLGRELELAESLINSAFIGLPDNPAVIDSKGWLAYRQGDLLAAIDLLKRAFKLAPSADIAAHLGEVLWQNQQTELAIAIWRQGKSIDPTNHILIKTLERFDVSL